MPKLTKAQSLRLDSHRTPHSFFTPTHLSLSSTSNPEDKYTWQSRKARKGRYGVKAHHVHYGTSSTSVTGVAGTGEGKGGDESGRERETVHMRLKSLESEFKPGLKGDVSFWIAIAFTFGSAVWVVNGFLVFLPILRPDLDTDSISLTAAATAFVGGTIFEIGSYLMVVEALDRGRETAFGTALGRLLHRRRVLPKSSSSASPSSKNQTKRGQDEKKLGLNDSTESENGGKTGDGEDRNGVVKKSGFVWWGKPMWHDLGYLAAIVQLFAATVFWISTITGLPGVIPGFSDGDGSVAIVDVFFWTPQVVGGCGFIVSSLILMIEVQTKWYIPNLTDLGWHIGLWNLIGAFGFMLCGAFGYSPASGMVYQSGCSTFWGSPAFLIGSFFQVYEVIWREPSPSPAAEKSGSR